MCIASIFLISLMINGNLKFTGLSYILTTKIYRSREIIEQGTVIL